MKKRDIIDAAIMLVREKWQAAEHWAPDESLSWQCELHKTEQTLHTLYHEYGGGKHPTNPTYTGPDRYILEKEKAKMKILTSPIDPEARIAPDPQQKQMEDVRIAEISCSESQRELAALGLVLIKVLLRNDSRYGHCIREARAIFSKAGKFLGTRTLRSSQLLGADPEAVELKALELENAMRKLENTLNSLKQNGAGHSKTVRVEKTNEHNADLYPNAYPKSLVD